MIVVFSYFQPSYKEHFVSLGDYYVVDPSELGLAEGDEVEVMRVGTNGWWYARHLRTDQEGWVPSTYLEPVSRVHSLYSSSGEGSTDVIVAYSPYNLVWRIL